MYDISALTYQPSTNMDWYTKAIFGGKLIEKGKITPVIGVKESTTLNLIDIAGNILQADARDCSWNPQQIAKLSEKELKIKTYKINLEQCIDDLERKRTVWMLSPGAKNTELPDSLEEATMAILASELSKEIETKIFSGNSTTNPNDFDGVTKVLTDSTEVIKIEGEELTKSNVLDAIERAVTALPSDILAMGLEAGAGFENTLSVYVSYATYLKIKMALAGIWGDNVVIKPNFTVEGDRVRYMGVEIVPVLGIGENDIIVADSKNLLLGTDLVSDLEEIRLGQFPAPNDSKIFIDGRLRLGFAILFESEVVFSSPDNPAPAGRSVATTTTGGTTKVYEKTAVQVITEIKAAKTIEEVQSLIEGDDRKTVNDEANKRIAEIQASSTTTGGE